MIALNPYAVKNSAFTQKIDVVCPRCEKKALVIGADVYVPMEQHEEKVRCSCLSCGYAVKYADIPRQKVFVNSQGVPRYSRVLALNSPVDPFFSLPLWYRIETKYGLIWAYNQEHLNVIANYIADNLRQRQDIPMQNNSIASRMPKWVGDAKNREYLLRLLRRHIDTWKK